MRCRWLIALATISWTAIACGGESRGPAFAGVRDTLPNGAVVVRYARFPEPRGAPLQPDLSIGVTEGDPHLMFGDVRGVEVAGDGTMYVLDYQASEVRAYDAQGGYLRTLARRGAGPGELMEANGMVLVGDTALWIQDHGQWMMIALDLRGEELTRVRMHVRAYGYIWDGTIDQVGRFWKPTAHSDAPRQYPPREGLNEGRARRYLKSYDPRTEVSDSVYLGEQVYRSVVARNNSGGYSYRGVPHDPEIVALVDPSGGFWQVSGTAYRIARRDERGDTTLVIEAETEGIPVTDRDRESYVDREVESSPGDRRVAEEVAALIPAFKSAVAALVLDDTGRLWVRRAPAEGAPTTYDVFHTDGAYVGTVVLGFTPFQYLPIRVRRGRVYGLVRDSLDVPSVVRTVPLPAFLR
jgi:hypothetical protein